MKSTGLILAVAAFLLTAVTVQADDIATLQQLQDMRDANKNYVLVNDIDASPTTNWNELIDNGTWADSEDYERVMDVSHPLVAHDGLTYYALQSSGPNYGGAQEPGVIQLVGTASGQQGSTDLVGSGTLFAKLKTNTVIRVGSGAGAESRTIATIIDDETLTVTLAWDSEHTYENIFQPAAQTAYWINTELAGGHKLGFEPVRRATSPFAGSFDGGGFTVSNLYINRPDEEIVGLFGSLDAQTKVVIRNLTLTDVDITGGGRVGSVAGYGSVGSAINRCGSSGTVRVVGLTGSTMPAVGGLQGSTYQGSISNSWSTATVIALYGYPAGGLVGLMHSTGNEFSGYLVNSFALGDVTGTSGSTGGLVGSALRGATISNCYARGTVTANSNARYRGGLVGNLDRARLYHSYSTGTVLPAGGSNGGGLVGRTVTTSDWYVDSNNFWDTETSDWATSAMGTGRTTEQMKDISTFLSWEIATGKGDLNDGYPFLNWDEPPVWRIPPVPGTVLRVY